MPQLAEMSKQPPETVVFSVGGSALHPTEHFNVAFVKELMCFTLKLTQEGKITILVTGGGSVARDAQADAKQLGVYHQATLDQIGVYITSLNALWLERVFEANGIHTHTLHSGDILHNGIIYMRGGSEPGHTTDFVAVSHAIEANQKILFNISTTPGLHPIIEGKMNEDEVIHSITWDHYLKNFSVDHVPGINTPFDKPGSLLAKEHGMTVVLLGPDFDNISRLLAGEEFIGTIIHP